MNWYNLDVAQAWQLGFQDPASPIMEEIVNFHHYVMVYLTFILFAVAYILVETLRTYNQPNRYRGTWLQIFTAILRDARDMVLIIIPMVPLFIYWIITIEIVECSPQSDWEGTIGTWKTESINSPSLNRWAKEMSFNTSYELKKDGKYFDLTPVDHPTLLCDKPCSFENAMQASKQTTSEAVRTRLADNYQKLVLRIKDLFSSVTSEEIKLIEYEATHGPNVDTTSDSVQSYNFAHNQTNNMSGGTPKIYGGEPWVTGQCISETLYKSQTLGKSYDYCSKANELTFAWQLETEKFQILGLTEDKALEECANMPRHLEVDPNLNAPMIIFKQVPELKDCDEGSWDSDPTSPTTHERYDSEEEQQEQQQSKRAKR